MHDGIGKKKNCKIFPCTTAQLETFIVSRIQLTQPTYKVVEMRHIDS